MSDQDKFKPKPNSNPKFKVCYDHVRKVFLLFGPETVSCISEQSVTAEYLTSQPNEVRSVFLKYPIDEINGGIVSDHRLDMISEDATLFDELKKRGLRVRYGETNFLETLFRRVYHRVWRLIKINRIDRVSAYPFAPRRNNRRKMTRSRFRRHDLVRGHLDQIDRFNEAVTALTQLR